MNDASNQFSIQTILGDETTIKKTQISSDGPSGRLPISEDQLLNEPSGNLFGLTQNVGMGWRPEDVGRPQYLILYTQGGLFSYDI